MFRHKWKILLCSLIGFLATAILFATSTPMYRSTAKLLVRYVMDNASVNPTDGKTRAKSPDIHGENIINSELEIITSWDLALKAVEAVGVDKLLGNQDLANGRNRAAAMIA